MVALEAIIHVHLIMFVKNKGLDLPFALDDQAQTVWKAVGGTESLPQTIVLDRNGVVIYNRRKSVDKALLDSLYEEAFHL